MPGKYLYQATTTSFQIPSNLSLTNHGRQNEQCDMLTAPSSDPHNTNTSSLLSIRYTACNTAVKISSSLLWVSFYPLFHLILLLPSFITLWYYYLFINWFIHVFTHSFPHSPFFFSLPTYNSSVRNSLVYSFLPVLELSLIYVTSIIPSPHVHFFPSFLFDFMSSTVLREEGQSPRKGLSNVR